MKIEDPFHGKSSFLIFYLIPSLAHLENYKCLYFSSTFHSLPICQFTERLDNQKTKDTEL